MNSIEKLLDRHILSKFFTYNSSKNIANNTLWLSLDKIIKIALGVFVGLGVAKYLGPVAYGQISYGLLYFSFFLPLATLALDQIVVRDLSQNPTRRPRILGTLSLMRLCGAFVAFIVAVSTAYILQHDQPLIVTIVIINASLFLMQSLEGCDLVFQTSLKSKYSTYARTSNYILFSIIKLLLIYNKLDLIAFVWVYALELLFNTLFLFLIYQWKVKDIQFWKFDFGILSQWLKECPFLILQTFLFSIQGRADQFMLEKILDIRAFGEYSLAARLIEMTYFLPVALAASSASRISDSKLINEDLYQNKLKNLYKLMVYLFFIMTIPIILFGKLTFDTFFEGKFESAGLIFVLLSSRLIYLNISVVKSYFFVNENLVIYSLWYSVIGIIVNLTCNYFLIPRYEIYGAIISMNISSFVTTFVLDYFFRATRKNAKILSMAITDILTFRNLKFV